MNKILKLTGVSMLAIVAASNANAAGYTCEELIEYTSCNQGYYLNSGKCIESATCGAGNYLMETCPDGYVYSDAWCLDAEWVNAWSKEECEDFGAKWYGAGCVKGDKDDPDSWMWAGASGFDASVMSVTCTPCAAGSYQPSAGQYECSVCVAGTYQPESGKTSCIDAPVGNYVAGVGATAYTACPVTGLTDKDGNTVVATTASTGSTSPAACVVGEEHYFTDTKGTYHYTSDCWYAAWDISVTTEEQCALIAARESVVTDTEWVWDGENCRLEGVGHNVSSSFAPATEEECNEAIIPSGGMGYVYWEDNQCMCEYEWIFDENGLSCNAA